MKQHLSLTVLLIVPLLFCNINLKAQVLEKVVTKFKSVQTLSYTVEFKEKELFGDSVYQGRTTVALSVTGNSPLAFQETGMDEQEVFDGFKLLKFSLADSTYRILNDTKITSFNYKLVPNIIAELTNDLKKKFPVTQRKDSIIDEKAYYNVTITERDSVVNNTRTFRFITVLIDKKSLLPYIYRNESQGFIDGTNTFIKFFSEYRFIDYKINSKTFEPVSVDIPPHFSLEKPKVRLSLLAPGTKAPELDLADSLGAAFTLASQKGKIVLLNFTSNGCPHCVASVEMLNALHKKYRGSEFLIVTLNPFDSKQSIQKNNKRFSIKYPTFTNPADGKKNVEHYRVQGYPTFYLIDKQGDIVKGFTGYYPALDNELIGLLDGLVKQ